MHARTWSFSLLAVGLAAFASLGAASDCGEKAGQVKDAAVPVASKGVGKIEDAIDRLDSGYYYPLGGNVEVFGFSEGKGDHKDRDLHALDMRSDQTAVYPTRPGKIAFAGWNCDKSPGQPYCYGNTVAIDHGDGTYAIYTHLAEKPAFKEGDSVTRRTKLGNIGETGCPDCGVHLHFAVRSGEKGLRGATDVLFAKANTSVDVRDKLQHR